MYTEEVFDETCKAAYVYFNDDSTLVLRNYGGGYIKSRLSVERYFERHCGSFKVEIDLEEDGLRIAWGFDGTTLRDRGIVVPKSSEAPTQAIVRMIDGILERYGHPDTPQPVEEPDIVRLVEGVAERWAQAPRSGLTLEKEESLEGLTWIDDGQSEVLSVVPASVGERWQINIVEHHVETVDWSSVDMSGSIRDVVQMAAGLPRIPRMTTLVFRDQDNEPSSDSLWLFDMHEELWRTVEMSLDMYSDYSL